MAIRSVALAGMISDTSLYNIDGACVVGGATAIPAGTAVSVTSAQPVDGHKIVTAANVAADPATGAGALGVVVRSHYDTPDGTARVNEAVNVLTAGRIWMRTTLSSAPTFGASVLINEAGVVAAGGVATGWTFAGGFVTGYTGTDPIQPGQSVDGALVEVQVKQK
ncbi:hypothetical protein bas02_0006 [Veterinaerplatzvirus Jeanpiccard]|uniref:Uncharacterized protein n=1 Tax=Escherichia phage JeanPiccard TaxID=2851955 RepID=A0AAE8B004_9CAUD|nr:hypothetical protein bas02_0006 [Escherichia phage JeanPiccard]